MRYNYEIEGKRPWNDLKTLILFETRLNYFRKAKLVIQHRPPVPETAPRNETPRWSVWMAPTTPDRHVRSLGAASRAFEPEVPTAWDVGRYSGLVSPLVLEAERAPFLAEALRRLPSQYRLVAVHSDAGPLPAELQSLLREPEPIATCLGWRVFSPLSVAEPEGTAVARLISAFRAGFPVLAARHCISARNAVEARGVTVWTEWEAEVALEEQAAACSAMCLPASASADERRAILALNVRTFKQALLDVLEPKGDKTETFYPIVLPETAPLNNFANGRPGATFSLDEFTTIHHVNDMLSKLGRIVIATFENFNGRKRTSECQLFRNWVAATVNVRWISEPIGIPEPLQDVLEARAFAKARNAALAVLTFSPISDVESYPVEWAGKKKMSFGEVVHLEAKIRHGDTVFCNQAQRDEFATACEVRHDGREVLYTPGCLTARSQEMGEESDGEEDGRDSNGDAEKPRSAPRRRASRRAEAAPHERQFFPQDIHKANGWESVRNTEDEGISFLVSEESGAWWSRAKCEYFTHKDEEEIIVFKTSVHVPAFQHIERISVGATLDIDGESRPITRRDGHTEVPAVEFSKGGRDTKIFLWTDNAGKNGVFGVTSPETKGRKRAKVV